MQSRTISAVIVVALVAAAAGLFFILRDAGGDDEQAATTTPPAATDAATEGEERAAERARRPQPPTIVVRDGEPAGGVRELEFTRGDRVRFRVRTDAPDEVHVHGYELYEDVAPGRPASFSFDADIEGGFEVELHDVAAQIAHLRVVPG